MLLEGRRKLRRLLLAGAAALLEVGVELHMELLVEAGCWGKAKLPAEQLERQP